GGGVGRLGRELASVTRARAEEARRREQLTAELAQAREQASRRAEAAQARGDVDGALEARVRELEAQLAQAEAALQGSSVGQLERAGELEASTEALRRMEVELHEALRRAELAEAAHAEQAGRLAEWQRHRMEAEGLEARLMRELQIGRAHV